jgi:hypothetical protein
MLNASLLGFIKINTVPRRCSPALKPNVFNSLSPLGLHKMGRGLCVVQIHTISTAE